MKLSTKGRYGTRAMVDIALHSEPSMLKDIANRQGISPKYLDRILSSLRKAGLIKNIRGKDGGYLLTRPASTITLKEVITAVEGPLRYVGCVDDPDSCERSLVCCAREVWEKLKDAAEAVLETTTLETLTACQNTKRFFM
jgi:Rrf2 family protein